MTSERDESRLVEYLYGELSADEARAFERALTDDPAAAADARALESVLALAREVDAPVEPPAFLDAKIMAAARAEVAAQAESARARGWRRWLTGPSVGGALIAMAASALVVLNLDLLAPRSSEHELAPVAAPRAPATAVPAPEPAAPEAARVAAKEAVDAPAEPPAATSAALSKTSAAEARRELQDLELRGGSTKDTDSSGGEVGGLGASRTRAADKRPGLAEEVEVARGGGGAATGARGASAGADQEEDRAPADAPAKRRARAQAAAPATEALARDEADDVSSVVEKKAEASKAEASKADVATARADEGAASGPAPARQPAAVAPAPVAPAAAPVAQGAIAGDALAPKGLSEEREGAVGGKAAAAVDPQVVRAAVALALSDAEAKIRAGDLDGARRMLVEARTRWGVDPTAAVLSLRLGRLAEQRGQAAEARRWAQDALARTQDEAVRREARALLARTR